ncbi:MAG TPA: hypothetical protein VMK65_00390, partial [Longimicrobiales bacterium]|nr:hypothetical protein [Longimicrobiales bacterium]
MIATLAYMVMVSALLGLAAAAAEAGLRARGRPARWVWGAAMAASLAVPLAVWLLAVLRPAPPAAAAAPIVVPMLAPILVGVPASGTWAPSPYLLPLLWGIVSLLLVGRLVLSWLALRHTARRWPRRSVDGVSV